MRIVTALFVLAAHPVLAADPLRFWNLTNETIAELRLAPAGTDAFGPNQCANDRDGEVDHDERLRLSGISPGRYDVRVVFKRGRACTVRGVELRGEGRYAFSLEESDLTDCRRPQ
ncbi:MAG TPA: hypothetical protein VE650_16880 [Acetobacteraceae bacterium]|jgi:hypothetical protein|nr:hypothetical protein [Acetobacteraceae bacterium]